MPVQKDDEGDETTPKKAIKKPSPLMLVGIVVVVLIVVLVAVVEAFPKKQGSVSVKQGDVEATSAPLVPSAVQKSIDDLKRIMDIVKSRISVIVDSLDGDDNEVSLKRNVATAVKHLKQIENLLEF
jgi:flagellar basal body-associated protein FliL